MFFLVRRQEHDDDLVAAPYCFICQESTEEDKIVKGFTDQTWGTEKKTTALRKCLLTSDKYVRATRLLESSNTQGSICYHPSFRKNYSAVKRPKGMRDTLPDNDLPVAKCVRVETRRVRIIPKFDHRGLLKGPCIICGKARKKEKGGREEPRYKVSTSDGCKSLSSRLIFQLISKSKVLCEMMWTL